MAGRPLDIAIAFMDAWTDHRMDRAAEFIADDIVFDGPMQKSAGMEPYLNGLRNLADDVTGYDMIAAFGDDDQALLMYDLRTKSYGTLTCAKNLVVRDGRIVRDHLTFDSKLIRDG